MKQIGMVIANLLASVRGVGGGAPSPTSPGGVMAPEDAAVVRAFASGEDNLRERAIAIHRRYIPILGVRGGPEQRFMAEVDNPAPDLALRRAYRDALTRERKAA